MSTLAAADFETLATLLRQRSGYAIGPDKSYLIETRLTPLVRREGCASLAELVARLRRPGGDALARDVTEAMTTNETLFFRDEKPFAHLRDVAIRALAARRAPGVALRIWSAAASTGQEAYSIAIVIHELAAVLGDRPVEIVGTDIARDQLARAREAVFSDFETGRGLTGARLARHFERVPGGVRAGAHLRRMVRFCEHNVLTDPRALGVFDVVFCRNVLIYFDLATKARALAAIATAVAPDGLLYLGAAETVLGVSDRFALTDARGVFRVA